MIETRLLRITLPNNGAISLGLVEKRASATSGQRRPILLVHGATFGHVLFDLPRAGYSLMDELARTGRTVYALDIRGYGHSVGGAVMAEPPAHNTPFAALDAAVEDIAAAVNFILAAQGAAQLDLVAFSWGTVTASRYAGAHPQKVARLALCAPLFGDINDPWLQRIADPADRQRLASSFGAYRLVTLADVVQRCDSELPAGNAALYREDGIAELIFEACAALDPLAGSRTPRAFRCPNGALCDLVRIFNGQPLYQPERLTMPALLLRGADDVTSTDADSRRLLARIASPDKFYRVISPGSHLLCVERNRGKLYGELETFLRAP